MKKVCKSIKTFLPFIRSIFISSVVAPSSWKCTRRRQCQRATVRLPSEHHLGQHIVTKTEGGGVHLCVLLQKSWTPIQGRGDNEASYPDCTTIVFSELIFQTSLSARLWSFHLCESESILLHSPKGSPDNDANASKEIFLFEPEIN